MKKVDELLSENLINSNIYLIIKLSSTWIKIMGDFIGKNSVPIKLNKDQLVIAVSDNIWMNEFTLMKSEFLQRLNQFGYKGIRDVKFVVKNLDKRNDSPILDLPITDEMVKKAKEFSKVIKNEELREKYEKAFLKYLSVINIHQNII